MANTDATTHTDGAVTTFSDFVGHHRFDEVVGGGTDYVCNMWILARVDNIDTETQDNYLNRLRSTNKNVLLVRDPTTLYVYSRFPKEKQSTQASVFANALELNEKVQKNLNITKPARLGPKAKDMLASYMLHLIKTGMSHRIVSTGNRQIEGLDIATHFLNESAAKSNSNDSERFHLLACYHDLHHVISNGLIPLENYWEFIDYQDRLERMKSSNRGIDKFHPRRKPRTVSLYAQLLKMEPTQDTEVIRQLMSDESIMDECQKNGITQEDILSFNKIRRVSTTAGVNSIRGSRKASDQNTVEHTAMRKKKRLMTSAV